MYTCSPHSVPRRESNEMLKQIHIQLYPPERPHWHGDIKKHQRSTAVFTVNFEKMQYLFLVFDCLIWGSVAGCIYQQRSKYRQVKTPKHASAGTNYAILTERVKVIKYNKGCAGLSVLRLLTLLNLWLIVEM